MLDIPAKYLTDAEGRKLAVVLGIETYQKLLEDQKKLEILEDARDCTLLKEAIAFL